MSQDRLEASLDIDRRSTLEIVRIIQEQDCLVADAVAAEAERIAQAIDRLAERLASGGHLFYAGAGTSGRIAMLDAAELPPTFGSALINKNSPRPCRVDMTFRSFCRAAAELPPCADDSGAPAVRAAF